MNKKVSAQNNANRNSFKFRHYSTLFIILFGFWLALSGRTDCRSLILGGLIPLIDSEMPINPQVIRLKKPIKNPLAHVVLGDSIILPSATLTMDIEGGEPYIIHALDDEFAEALLPKSGEEFLKKINSFLVKIQNKSGYGTKGWS